MKNVNVIKKGINAEVVDLENGQFIIKAGATIKPAQKSLRSNLLLIRNSIISADNVTTNKDVTLSSLSAVATILSGSMANGNKFFNLSSKARAPKVAPTKTTTSTPTTAPAPTTTPTETKEEQPAVIQEKAEQEADNNNTTDEERTPEEIEKRVNLLSRLDSLCGQWGFKCDPRISDSLLYIGDLDSRKNFIYQCSELEGLDECLLDTCKNLLESAEFSNISDSLDDIKPWHSRICSRLYIYYGVTGAGKTTYAKIAFPNALKEVAKENDKPSELFTTFNPTTNKYEKTALAKCAEEGRPYLLDEGNLLPRACWSRLQSILDNTKTFVDRGIEITIADNFKFITTLNLETNFGKRPLPDPIVSRACEVRKFERDYANETKFVW